MPSRSVIPTLALGFALFGLIAGGPRSLRGEETSSVVYAIGDIHGAQGALTALLRSAELIDEDGHWSGGTATLVQTGDFLDRGDNAVPVARFLRRLREEATASGGRVEVLLGNHEALNMLRRFDEVTPKILEPYATEDSEERRQKLCRKEAPRRRREARERQRFDHSVEVPSKVVALNRCLRDHPLGFIEYVEDLGPEGDLGSWLRTLPASVRIGDTLYIHGGISPSFSDWELERLNEEVRLEIERFDEARIWMTKRGMLLPTDELDRIVGAAQGLAKAPPGAGPPIPDAIRKVARLDQWLLARSDGPLWFRGYAQWSDADGAPRIDKILEDLGVERVVVGHTTMTDGQIRLRFDGRIALIDTGMLTAVYKGRPAALERTGTCLTELQLGGRTPLIGCDQTAETIPADGP